MANTLTGLIPNIYEALDIVARERIGFAPAVTLNASHDGAALNQIIRSPVAPVTTSSTITPGATSPAGAGQTISYMDFSINNSESAQVTWQGEEQLSVKGIYTDIQTKQFVQAF